ncbi:hypothetical protein P154DRAFT_4339 [Amniculicola lignicola CBS 123094]|uniref:Uncharacterized protein n=1 Tax=Amniculicola lignicola CBS 123094 TaxID=1392246 RepID=A0A6A5X4E6_9PLEO|nr:hypothetical protein P154DRAFT_4339 [Amniculicola lignicola CBS 123094]
MAGLSSDTTSSESPSSNLSVLVIGHSEAGVQKIFEMVGRPSFDITKYSELEIHINAGNLDPWTDDRLAIILDCFRPNHVIHRPHHLEHIAIVSHGNILFTRHNYTLTSPAVSYDINNHLHKLMANSLTESEKRAQSYKIFSTDKAFARAILNIRDVPLVTFRCAGNGTIEQYFLKEIEHTVALPSGKPVLPSPPPSKRHKSKAESLYRKGTFESQGYKTNFKNPYPLRNIDKKKSLIPGKDALLVDQLSMIHELELYGHKSWICRKDARSCLSEEESCCTCSANGFRQ